MIHTETGRIDGAATESKRARMRADRLRKAKPFSDFMKGWRKRRPKDEIIAYYGDWPEPRAPAYDNPFWGQFA